jgi:hypothetical protein
MKKEWLTKIKAARKAFHAYEAAVKAAQEATADGPVRRLGTAVMVSQPSIGSYIHFKCSECEFIGYDDWKFCAGCGAEIMRFDRSNEPETNVAHVQVEVTTKDYGEFKPKP